MTSRLGPLATVLRPHLSLALIALVTSCHCLAATRDDTGDPETQQFLRARANQQMRDSARHNKTFFAFEFTDKHAASGITFEHNIVDDSCKNWKAVHYDHGSGITVADVDGDGLLDIYFVDQLGKNELWRNRGGGTFEDITDRAGVGLEDRVGVTASFADVDNDGDADLFVTSVRGGNVLFENNGKGVFKNVSKAAGVDYVGHSSGAVFFDFNNDGLLDLFVANVGVYTMDEKGAGGFYLSAENAFGGHLYPERTEYSLLYQNLGGMKFKEVSREMKLRDGSWSGDATFCDLDKDGYADLYVLNMQGHDHFYRNVGGKGFVEITKEFFPKTSWGAMGVKFFDFDLDGDMDLYTTDMHSDMTPLQTRLARNMSLAVEKAKSEQWCGPEWGSTYLAGRTNENVFGNSFYENAGEGKFAEVSDRLGAETFWPWGVSVEDFNADGYEDVFVASGMNYPFRYAVNSLLLNHRGERFFDAEFLVGIEPRAGNRVEKNYFILDCGGADADHPRCEGKTNYIAIRGALGTRSSVSFDLDGDGDLDIVTAEFNDRPQVLVSNLSEQKDIRFLKVRLVGKASNRDGLGAWVTVRASGQTFTRYCDGKSGYLSQSRKPLYFGLGDAKQVESIEVSWPSGRKQTLKEDLKINQLIEIEEPAS